MSASFNFPSPLVLLGAGGHAKVLVALVRELGLEVAGVCSPQLAADHSDSWYGISVWGSDEAAIGLDPNAYGLINGVGQLPNQNTRQSLYDKFRSKGFAFPPLIHPNAWVAPDVELADGVQVMAGALIQPGCTVGANTIINTRASIDHDCHIGAHVHIAPSATLCGGITVANKVFIGAGATVANGLSIGNEAIIGLGTACIRDVAPGETAIGAAGRYLSQK